MSLLPDRAARAFPLLLLGFLLGVAVMLNRMTDLPYFAPVNAAHEPDLTIYNFTATGYDIDGHPLYHLAAARMKHYQDDSADFDHPHMLRTEIGAAPLTVIGDTAHLTDKGNHVWFGQHVTLRSEGDGKAPPVTVHTTQLSLDVPSGNAATDAPADAESNGNHLHSVGFDYDNKAQVLKLHSKVRIDYAPPKH